jgi:cell division protein FtsN
MFETSEPEEKAPVHYQISITGRQAAAFFFLLLAALGLSFFFGMKTGAAAKRGSDPAAAIAAAVDATLDRTKPDDERARPTAVPDADRKLGFPDKVATPPAAPDEKTNEKVAGKAAKALAPKPTAKPIAKPTEKPNAAAAAAPEKIAAADTKAAAAAKPPAKKEGPLWLQFLATQKAPVADEFAARLKKEGFPADVSLISGKPGWFRVRVGPYADRTKAEEAGKKIRQVDKGIKNPPLIVPAS